MLTHDIGHTKRTKLTKKQKERKNRKLSYFISIKNYFLLLKENSVIAK